MVTHNIPPSLGCGSDGAHGIHWDLVGAPSGWDQNGTTTFGVVKVQSFPFRQIWDMVLQMENCQIRIR